MGNNRNPWLALLAAALAGAALPGAASAERLTTLYSFAGGADGAFPGNGLLMDKNGALYGTTEGGDTKKNFGTVFMLTPPKNQAGKWTKQNLYSFKGGKDGALPWTQLIFDLRTGALLGTTTGSETAKDFGTVFRLVPRPKGKLPWTEQIIHRFAGGSDSAYPYDGLAQDESNGAVYGTTYGQSGASDFGSVFGYTPALQHSKPWTRTLHYAFTGAPGNGAYPRGGLVLGRALTLYGTTFGGGDASASCRVGSEAGCGTIFQASAASRKVGILHLFEGAPTGASPSYENLLRDKVGTLYGTTEKGGGASNCALGFCGTVFSFDPDTSTFQVLHHFTRADGSDPNSGVIFGLLGELYGTTRYGGKGGCPSGCGVVFKLTPLGHNKWDYSVVYKFTGGHAGGGPHALVIDSEGVLYGEAEIGGDHGFGTVFKIAK